MNASSQEIGERELADIVEQLQLEVEFWRIKYEEERERVGKLWVAYKDVEAELGGKRQPAAPAPRAEPATQTVATRIILEAPAVPTGPFTYQDFTLYRLDVHLKNGRTQTIYFFSRHKPRQGQAVALPDGYAVGTSARTGLPFLRRSDRPMHQAAAGSSGAGAARQKHLQAQCAALTEEGHQCRNSTHKGSRYCASHENYRAPTARAFVEGLDTTPRVAAAPDTTPAVLGVRSTSKGSGQVRTEAVTESGSAYRPQCAAVIEGGDQCRNSARQGSRYCASHRGYHPKGVAALLAQRDIKPRVKRAEDSAPVLRAAAPSR